MMEDPSHGIALIGDCCQQNRNDVGDAKVPNEMLANATEEGGVG